MAKKSKPPSVDQQLAQANRYHQAGQLDLAIELYHKLLRQVRTVRYPLAVAYYQKGDLAQAQIYLQQVLQQAPNHPEACYTLGRVHADLGELQIAITYFEQALTQRPASVEVLNSLGNALTEAQQPQRAVQVYRQALALQPGLALLHYNLGQALEDQFDHQGAVAAYQQAIQLAPTWSLAYQNLGHALFHLERGPEAIAAFEQALGYEPNQPEIHRNLGCVLALLRRYDEALAHYQKALALQPDHYRVYDNLGSLFVEQKEFIKARQVYDQALSYNPQDAEAHANLGVLLLLTGALTAGWAEYTWRWQTAAMASRAKEIKPYAPWDGSSLSGKTILLFAEQGLGDVIQFVRFATAVKALGAHRVIVQSQPPLLNLLATLAGVDRVIPLGEPLPAFDVCTPLMDLPHKLGIQLSTIPGAAGYLHAPERCTLPEALQTALTQAPGLKVGIAWAPKLSVIGDRKRYCPLQEFKPLLALKGVAFFSVYQGKQSYELEPFQDQIVDLGSQFQDFQDTAWALAQLDLIITVDTSVAHLGGALGRPTWILLAAVPDWRWLMDREDSPWYDSVRLFRQQEAGNWPPVLQQVAQALAAQLAGQG